MVFLRKTCVALALLALAVPINAQERASVAGLVRDGSTLQPLGGPQATARS